MEVQEDKDEKEPFFSGHGRHSKRAGRRRQRNNRILGASVDPTAYFR